MPWDALFFFIIAAACLLSALLVVVSENPVHSGIFMVLSFINVAAIFVLLGAEFLAVIQIIVYTGAVLVLLLFVLMLVDPAKLPSFYVAQPLTRFVSALIGLVLLLEVGAAIISRTALEHVGPDTQANIEAAGGNVQRIGQVMFSDYVLALEIASLVLTVGVVGAVVIGVPERLRERTSTISLGHPKVSMEALAAGPPKFETPIPTREEPVPAMNDSRPRRVVMTKSADDYKRVGEIDRV